MNPKCILLSERSQTPKAIDFIDFYDSLGKAKPEETERDEHLLRTAGVGVGKADCKGARRNSKGDGAVLYL